MARHGKKYLEIKKKAPQAPVSLEEAVTFIKAHAGAKFDETIELALRLGVDTKKSDQTVRGTVSLPHGTGKTVRVIAFASGAQADAAKAAGATTINLGLFINTVIDFVIQAFVIFMMIQFIQRLKQRTLPPAPVAPTTKTCPFCCSTIATKAVRCPQCTSDLKAVIHVQREASSVEL